MEKCSIFELINYLSISGDSKQKTKFPQQKVVVVLQLLMGRVGWGGGSPTLWYVPPKTVTFFAPYSSQFLEQQKSFNGAAVAASAAQFPLTRDF